MKNKFYLGLCLIGLFIAACGARQTAVEVVEHNGHKLYVCDFFKITDDSLHLKLSDLLESFKVIKLEDTPEAIVGRNPVAWSDHYLLIRSDREGPFKLFNHDGKFLGNIGDYGRGPGEYTTVYDSQLDEKNGRVYLMPWTSGKLQVYDFQGNFIDTVPLAERKIPKGCFKVEENGIWMTALPFEKVVKLVSFRQTLDGKLWDSVVAAPPCQVTRNYGNELEVNRATRSLYFFIWEGKQDSLYRYSNSDGLVPYFTVDFKGIPEIPMHTFHEFGKYMYFETSKVVSIPGGMTNAPFKRALIDLEHLTATTSYDIDNDYLGIPASPWGFHDNWYVANYSPLILKRNLDKAIKRDDLSPETRKRVEELLAGIQEDGNNYILLGKMKETNF